MRCITGRGKFGVGNSDICTNLANIICLYQLLAVEKIIGKQSVEVKKLPHIYRGG